MHFAVLCICVVQLNVCALSLVWVASRVDDSERLNNAFAHLDCLCTSGMFEILSKIPEMLWILCHMKVHSHRCCPGDLVTTAHLICGECTQSLPNSQNRVGSSTKWDARKKKAIYFYCAHFNFRQEKINKKKTPTLILRLHVFFTSVSPSFSLHPSIPPPLHPHTSSLCSHFSRSPHSLNKFPFNKTAGKKRPCFYSSQQFYFPLWYLYFVLIYIYIYI